MKEGWNYKKIGEVCAVLNGFAFKSDKYTDSGTRVIRITNVQKGFIVDDDPKFYPSREMQGLNQYELRENDLLMSLTGNVGRVGLLKKDLLPAALNQRVACLRIKDNRLSLKFLFHWLNSTVFEQDAIFSASGIAQKNLSTEWLKSYKIGIPSLSEQQYIVEELDMLSSIIEKKKAQLNELDNLAQSLFYEMFGDPITNERKWNTLPLGQLSNMVRGPFGSALKKEFFVPQSKDTYKVYEQKHAIQKDDKIGDYYISKEKFEELRRFEVFSGDIIMSCSGTIGEFFEIPQGACKGVMNQALLKFKLNEALINKDYFLFVMQYVKKNFTVHGSGLQNIGSVKVIKSVRIGVPSLDLQSCFSQRLRAINETKILIKKSIEEVETLFNSRMDYYFN